MRLRKLNRIRIKYSLIMLPALIFSLFVSIFFQVRSRSQTELSRKINHLIFPLVCTQVLCWLVFSFVILIYIGILFPKKPHPSWSFGWAMGIVFIAFLSIFVVRNFVASTNDYEARMKKFSLVTRYQRDVTIGQLEYLYHKNTKEDAPKSLQHQKKCCGLNGPQDYNPGSGRFDAIMADNDKEDSRYTDCRISISWDAFLRNKPQIPKRIARLPKELRLKIDEDVPISCCKTIQPDCNKEIFKGDKGVLDRIFTKGCLEHFIEHIHNCHDYGTLFLLFSLPWLVWVYSCVVTWAHLRECQGLKMSQLGEVLCSEAAVEDAAADPKPPEAENKPVETTPSALHPVASDTTIAPFGPPASTAITKSTTNTDHKPT